MSGEDPGLQSVATAIGTSAQRSASTGGFCFSFQKIEGAREHTATAAGGGQRRNARLRRDTRDDRRRARRISAARPGAPAI